MSDLTAAIDMPAEQSAQPQPCIFIDIGGTHIRLAMSGSIAGQVVRSEKYPVANFPSLIDALNYYVEHYDIACEVIRIATAAWPHKDGVWRFAHKDRWEISLDVLKQAGWSVLSIENDFMASAKGTYFVDQEHIHAIRGEMPLQPDTGRYLVMGPGTGLGMAVIDYDEHIEGAPSVRTTFGGHMIAPSRTEEQRHVLSVIQEKVIGADKPLLAEYAVSGPGLDYLHQAVKLMNNEPSGSSFDMAYILENKDHPHTQKTLRLFHEFLGLFIHQAMLFTHSYDGVYLDGGVTQRLLEHKIFMTEPLLENIGHGHVPVVQQAIDASPIAVVNDPYIALRGLQLNAGTKT